MRSWPDDAGGSVTERQAVSVLLAAWIGATWALPVPIAVGTGLVLAALLARRSWFLVAGVLLLAGSLGARANANYQMIEPGPFQGEITLLSDPETQPFGVWAEARLPAGERVRLSVGPPESFSLERLSAGYRLDVSGALSALEHQPWFRTRHLVGDLRVESVQPAGEPAWWRRPSELLRTAVADGASSFSDEDAGLYRGLVMGDDRGQALAQQARFRAAGLSHLLAVSGQNVAFALAVVWPLARRCGGPARLAIILAVLFVFAVATRMEPSVLRATASACVAVWAAAVGRRSSGVRTLSLAGSALILIDPFLVESVGFRLSVAASAGILVGGPLLVARLPGPRPLAAAIGISGSAQLFVAPLLIATFGPVSLASLPANVLAGWAAGVVMIWGMSGGLVAGLVPAWEPWMQWPVGKLLGWIDGVATWGGRAPLPMVGGWGLLIVVAFLAGLWWTWPQPKFRMVLVGVGLVGLVLAHPSSPASPLSFTGGGRYWPRSESTPSVLLVAADADPRLIEALLSHRITSVDLVVFERAGSSDRRVNEAVLDVADPERVLAPPRHSLVGASRLTAPMTIHVAGTILHLTPAESRLAVSASG